MPLGSTWDYQSDYSPYPHFISEERIVGKNTPQNKAFFFIKILIIIQGTDIL